MHFILKSFFVIEFNQNNFNADYLNKKRLIFMKEPHELTPLSEVLNQLRKDGYKQDFIMDNKGLTNKTTGRRYKPEELTIIKVYRFEGESDPADMSVIYAMEADNGDKGIFLDAFGTYADYDGQKASEYFKKVRILKDH
jgi:hypothetical protein